MAVELGLGPVHGQVRIAHQLGGVGSVVRIDGYPDAAGGIDFGSIDRNAREQSRFDAKEEVAQAVHGGKGFERAELVAAQPGHHFAVLEAVAEPARQRLQHPVAGRVAIAVIDFLEAIEVDGDDCQVGVAEIGLGKCRSKPLVEQRAVGQAGEPVMAGHMGYCGLRTPPVGDIVDGGNP
jgi:hypothetical protein